MEIRDATAEDVPGMLAIYNDVVATSTAIYRDEPATLLASQRFHERLGFARVAHFREVGFKFGRWLDLVFLQRRLDA